MLEVNANVEECSYISWQQNDIDFQFGVGIINISKFYFDYARSNVTFVIVRMLIRFGKSKYYLVGTYDFLLYYVYRP